MLDPKNQRTNPTCYNGVLPFNPSSLLLSIVVPQYPWVQHPKDSTNLKWKKKNKKQKNCVCSTYTDFFLAVIQYKQLLIQISHCTLYHKSSVDDLKYMEECAQVAYKYNSMLHKGFWHPWILVSVGERVRSIPGYHAPPIWRGNSIIENLNLVFLLRNPIIEKTKNKIKQKLFCIASFVRFREIITERSFLIIATVSDCYACTGCQIPSSLL